MDRVYVKGEDEQMKYKTVVIYPPWNIANIGLAPKAFQHPERKPYLQKQTMKDRLCDRYDTIESTNIIDFPIDEYASEECLLFLWVTNSKDDTGKPIIKLGFEILEAWGFIYHNTITWDKHNAFALWSPIQGQTEHCLFAYRGNFSKLTNKQNAVMRNLIAEPVKRHSQKPARFYQLLRAWTPTPRIDIFARNAHEGFDGWGDEYVGEGPLAPYLKEKMK